VKKIIIASVAVALLLLACFEEEGVTPRVPDRVEPTSPAHVLRNVEISFNQRDINLLKAMLSADFVFYFEAKTRPGNLIIKSRSRGRIPYTYKSRKICSTRPTG
jgi:hypothetical protein